MVAAGQEQLHRARIALVLALLWSIGLLVFALLVPVDGSATLVNEDGTTALVVLALPAVVTVLAAIALHYENAHGWHAGRVLAWLCVFVLFVLALLGILSVGAFILPVAALLAYATAVTQPPTTGQPGPLTR